MAASTLDTDGRNGSLEVNGHVSPGRIQLESGQEADKPVATEVTIGKITQNEEAFTSNQSTTDDAAATLDKQKSPSPALATQSSAMEEAAEEAAGDASEDKMDVDVDAPTKLTVPDAAEEVSEPKQSDPQNDENTTPVLSAIVVSPLPASPALDAPPDSAPSPKTKDVEMKDTEAAGIELPVVVDTAESTQDTAVSDVPPVTPGNDANTDLPNLSGLAVDGRQKSPVEPGTADTSMSDVPLAAGKMAREREADSEEEPAAKRVRTDSAAENVPVETEVKAEAAQNRMDVDKPAEKPKSSSVYRANGELKALNDDSLNNNPITHWQNRQIRSILGGVKKTKAGALFKQSVMAMWPQLWNDYSARVANPTDISKMERRLRNEDDETPYANMGEFKSDLDLLVQNSITFNGDSHDVTRSAGSVRETILARMGQQPAAEPSKPDKKEVVKPHPTRHTEHPAVPTPKPVPESPAFAIPASSNGMPLIRRDSTKPDSRNKRPVKPAHSKDLVYDKRKKKLSPELRFCEEVLAEIRKSKHIAANEHFQLPVDPVALNIPSYHKIIKKPMDLSTMSQKMAAGEYPSAKEFEKDFDLIVKNCRTFNGDGHAVYLSALGLQDLFRQEMSKKDEWMAKNAPPATPAQTHAPSPRPKYESEDDESEAEPEPEQDEERKTINSRLSGFRRRLDEEQKRINELMNSGTSEISDIEIAQSVVNMLQRQILEERKKLAALPAPKAAKPKPTKTKKANTGGGGGGGSHNKKNAASGLSAGQGASASKKPSGKKGSTKRRMGALEKEVIAAGIADLDGPHLEKAIDIIKKDTGQGENDSGELELDIELLSDDALAKLYDIALKVFPNLRAEKERTFAPPPLQAQAAPRNNKAAAANKSKKNKPMSKTEQERRIQQLNELRAQAGGRQGSGSQEPMESIEGTGRGSADPTPQHLQDSEDEESSEEE
ncbi:hypothetical protein B0T17DRAFT_611459 [Bombardia bombarda]|uniref:Bromodomain-containing protein n=1 Tax=Bombardia bombarda TaxID=252184 RepID=A0AA40CDH9_9PEZI|nr:hypothetical protein B0T17DRAFT_611459 [Bombardia bombarda]